MVARLRMAQQAGLEVRSTGVVITQVWRDPAGRQANLARLLKSVDVKAIDDPPGQGRGRPTRHRGREGRRRRECRSRVLDRRPHPDQRCKRYRPAGGCIRALDPRRSLLTPTRSHTPIRLCELPGSLSDELDRAGQVGRAAKADVPRDQREVQQDRKGDVERVVEAQVMPPRPRQLPQRPEVGIAVVDEHPCGAQGEESLIGAEAGVSFMTRSTLPTSASIRCGACLRTSESRIRSAEAASVLPLNAKTMAEASSTQSLTGDRRRGRPGWTHASPRECRGLPEQPPARPALPGRWDGRRSRPPSHAYRPGWTARQLGPAYGSPRRCPQGSLVFGSSPQRNYRATAQTVSARESPYGTRSQKRRPLQVLSAGFGTFRRRTLSRTGRRRRSSPHPARSAP